MTGNHVDLNDKLEAVSIAIAKASATYSNHKNGWVTFKGNRPKMKLRKYVTMLAQKMSAINDSIFRVNRQLLIDYYNEDGLNGVNRVVFMNLMSPIKND